MERRQDEAEPLLELGTASTDTQGGLGDMVETMGLWHRTGIAEE
jgi:hypothetical protein